MSDTTIMNGQRKYTNWFRGLLGIQVASCTIANIIGQIAVGLMMVVVVVDVSGRYFFNNPLPAAMETTELLMVYAVFMGLGYTQRKGGHVRVEFLKSRLSPELSAVADIVALLLALFFVFMIGWQAGVATWFSVSVREASLGAVRVPLYISKIAIPLGALVMFFQIIIDLSQAFRRLFKA